MRDAALPGPTGACASVRSWWPRRALELRRRIETRAGVGSTVLLAVLLAASACQDADAERGNRSGAVNHDTPSSVSPTADGAGFDAGHLDASSEREPDAATAGASPEETNESGANVEPPRGSQPALDATAPDASPRTATIPGVEAPEASTLDAALPTDAGVPVFEAGAAITDPPDASFTPGGDMLPLPDASSDGGDAGDGGADGGVPDGGQRGEAGPVLTPCQAACQAAGGECVAEQRCEFDCTLDAACDFDIVCPKDYDCDVRCSGEDACAGNIACPGGADALCTVECGQDACKNGIECSGKRCDVSCGPGGCSAGNRSRALYGGAANVTYDCWGDGSCNGRLECNAQVCNLSCEGSGACRDGSITMNADVANLSCLGNGTCNDDIYCNAGDCNISCNRSVDACASN